MNEYYCYEKLRLMERIASQYASGQQYTDKLHGMTEEIAKKKYRVAFIGEFKKGKSSLINALLGKDILPMDILPMTATVTRIIYGTEQNCFIRFVDGHTELRTIKELETFATKKDAVHEKMAASVNEIIVKYPSVLCSNHIEVLDTPGLNESEAMSERTLQVLGKIDAAVVVISAELPLSETEQQLILDLIEQPGIHHLVFAVTFLDKLGSETDKNRALDNIRNRLKINTLELAEECFSDNGMLLEKSRRILLHPDVFGSSSLQARLAFQKDDNLLLQESRLPQFKEDLLALLTKAQNEAIPAKTLQMAQWLSTQLPEWKDVEEGKLKEELEKEQKRNNECINEIKFVLGEWLTEMNNKLENFGISEQNGLDTTFIKIYQKPFISQLSTIDRASNHHVNILKRLTEAKDLSNGS